MLNRKRASARGGMALLGLLAVTALVGCVADAPTAQPTSSATPTTAAPTPTPTPDASLVPGGSATDNRPYFDTVMLDLLARSTQPTSLEIVDTLVAAGFPRESLAVTADTTRVGDPADSILVAVLIEGDCLLGQVAGGSFRSEEAPVLGTGACLVGRTLSLD